MTARPAVARRSRHAFGLALLSCAVISLGAGCSGDDDATAGMSGDVTAVGGEAVDGVTTPATTPDGRPTLAALLSQRADASTKVTYQRGDREFSVAQDGGRHAVRRGPTLLLEEGGTNVLCRDLDADATCMEIPEEVAGISGTELTLFRLVDDGLVALSERKPLLPTTDETVAGVDAVCAETPAGDLLSELTEGVGDLAVADAEARVCLDAETGFLLEYSTTEPADTPLVAQRVQPPTDADFTPPVPVEPLPGGSS